MNMDDIFSQFGDIFGGAHPFERFFGGGGRGRQRIIKEMKKMKEIHLTILRREKYEYYIRKPHTMMMSCKHCWNTSVI